MPAQRFTLALGVLLESAALAAEERSPQYHLPHPFDWGVFKQGGEVILAVTAASYAILIIATLRRWSRSDHTARHHWAVKVAGFAAIVVMTTAASMSVTVQMSSSHYQEQVHLPAVAVIIGVWLVIRILGRNPKKAAKSCVATGDNVSS
jgi:hypothetical protein